MIISLNSRCAHITRIQTQACVCASLSVRESQEKVEVDIIFGARTLCTFHVHLFEFHFFQHGSDRDTSFCKAVLGGTLNSCSHHVISNCEY